MLSRSTEENSLRNNGWYISNYNENYKFTDPRSSTNPSTRNMKKTTPKCFIIKLFNNNGKEKNVLKSQRNKDISQTELKTIRMIQISAQKQCEEQHF